MGRLGQIEPESADFDDLSLQKQLRTLQLLKKMKDIEKGRAKGKGFANAQILNPSRSKNVYTRAESKFKRLCDSIGLKYDHETRFKVKDDLNRVHCYKLDFFFPKSRIGVEISPNFHFTYKIVAIRDKIREISLKEKHGITIFTIKADKNNEIDQKEAQKILNYIYNAETKPECIEYWFGEAHLFNGYGIAGGSKKGAE